MELKACIEILATNQNAWIPFPNGDILTAITDFTEDKDWECVIVTGLKENGRTAFVYNSFHKADIIELNNLVMELTKDREFDEEDYAVLNLLLEDRNFDVDEVRGIYEKDAMRIFTNVDNMGDIARSYLHETSSWYTEAKENFHQFDFYFDFESYGEEILNVGNNFLTEFKNYKIAVEVFE